jgi:hypothetical protein
LADQEGFIDYTIEAIGRRINLDPDKVEKAIDTLCKPDPTSRTDHEDGKRLLPIRHSFGWKITNYALYRDIKNQEERRAYMRNYMRNYRSKPDVNSGKQQLAKLANTDTDTDTDTNTKDSRSRAKKKTRSTRLSEAEWLATIKANKAYSHIDIDAELDKMDAWLSTRPSRQKTRRFVVNWLNKIDKPMGGKHGGRTQHDRNVENIKEFAGQDRQTELCEGGDGTQRTLPAHGAR